MTGRAVVVAGGTGVFGERLVRGLAAHTDFPVVVAARGLARAEALAASLRPGVTAARLDVAAVTTEALRALGAGVVVDAAGPFVAGQYGLAAASLAAGAHYVDLADGRDFVAGFGPALDDAARAAGRVALTGASSTPALSTAVLDRLIAGWTAVERVEVAILPGNRAPRGLSVMRSILSWTGLPVRVFLDGEWLRRPGWTLTRLVEVPGLGRRLASLAETPDLDVLPQRYAVREAAVFRAGLELPVLHGGMVGLARMVAGLRRLGWRGSARGLARPLRAVAALLEGAGTDRGAMVVTAEGVDADGQATRRRWTLVAEAGDGPVIPTLPALAAIRRLMAGVLPSGAGPCVGAVDLPAIAAEFRPYRLAMAEAEERLVPLFERCLGPTAFEALPEAVRAVHGTPFRRVLAGQAAVGGAEGWFARVVAACMGFPRAAEQVPVRVVMVQRGPDEIWTRDFGGRRFHSRLRAGAAGCVEECFGPFAFSLSLDGTGQVLTMQLRGWRLMALPLPRFLAPRIGARESRDPEGRFQFDVVIRLPWGRLLVAYRGWLVPVTR